MKKLILTGVAILIAAMLSADAQQQQPRAASTGGRSPHETTSAVIDQNRVTITYGRPYTKDPRTGESRKIWGGLVPYGKPWRMGADEATLLVTQKPILIGETTIPAGAYTLYMVPEETGAAKLAFSKTIGQWGVPVDDKNDVARVDLKKDTLQKTVDQFTMAVEKGADGGGIIKLSWENTQYAVAFTVKK
ncbi:MAG TPA: DUF2911 domain-containing protein [Verrucomicrobiae bacterium]|nr:DUF2911 domain-containing protein [Verrucomicrobiae bacterium]